MEPRSMERLSESSERRTVDRLQNGQIELCWDCMVLRMRTTDLIVLNNALRSWMGQPDREWAQTYCLLLDEYTMFIGDDDLVDFCVMVREATDQLPRRVVRWVDLDVRIVPYTEAHRNVLSCISLN